MQKHTIHLNTYSSNKKSTTQKYAEEFNSTVYTGSIDKIREVVEKIKQADPEFDFNSTTRYGKTALITSARTDHSKVLQYLLEDLKLNPNVQDQEGNTPLHVVKTVNSARWLIDNGADRYALNKAGNTPSQTVNHFSKTIKQDILEAIKYYMNVRETTNKLILGPSIVKIEESGIQELSYENIPTQHQSIDGTYLQEDYQEQNTYPILTESLQNLDNNSDTFMIDLPESDALLFSNNMILASTFGISKSKQEISLPDDLSKRILSVIEILQSAQKTNSHDNNLTNGAIQELSEEGLLQSLPAFGKNQFILEDCEIDYSNDNLLFM